ncbi:Crp/Fnr family transcriptional regulator [Mesorhizobium sp. AaZ16]|uniref:Crp/Fnr family transcriptional regulator n=1 Tax=Mesorhizobium sp. AaZ16 TaxID=3402289 RepID=UPI00374F7E6D
MHNARKPIYRNGLLRRLSPKDLALIEHELVFCDLPLRMVLEERKAPIEYVYFLEEGIGSVVAKTPKGRDTEVGLIGFEGMTGAGVVLGDDFPTHECYVQLAGAAYRLPTRALLSALSQSPTLRPFLLRYVQALHIQTGYTALVNARSKLEERLARWLLMCDDRVMGEKLTITHEFLSVMLGVRRPGVTVALQILEGKGFIRANRGEILLRDREGLIELTDGAYSEPEAEYLRLVGEIG